MKGFTLLELLVVLALVALTVTLVRPLHERVLPGLQVESAVRALVSGLRTARSRALLVRRETRLELDLDERRYRVPPDPWRTLPSRLSLELTTAASEQTAPGRGGIRFFPAGGSTGGRILVALEDRRVAVEVDWLTGRARVVEPGG